ncbi:MAG: hypothetical protein WB729_00225 [Candidatus Sulfotelmatobacter sp.]
MKKVVLVMLLAVVSVACGGTPKSNSTPDASTQISGAWTITANEAGSGTSVFSVNLVASQCSVSTPVGTFSVLGPDCFIADDNTGQGSISGTGQFLYPPQGVLVGSSTNAIFSNTTTAMDLLFVEADQFGDIAVFSGNGSIANGTMSGSWACNPNSQSAPD